MAVDGEETGLGTLVSLGMSRGSEERGEAQCRGRNEEKRVTHSVGVTEAGVNALGTPQPIQRDSFLSGSTGWSTEK